MSDLAVDVTMFAGGRGLLFVDVDDVAPFEFAVLDVAVASIAGFAIVCGGVIGFVRVAGE